MIVGVVALLVTGLGVALDLQGFIGNVVAGLAGVLLGVVVTYALVERLLREHRGQEWLSVRTAIVESLIGRLFAIGHAVALGAPSAPKSIVYLSQDDPTLVDALNELCDYLQDQRGRGQESLRTLADLHASVADEFAFIHTVVTPRVLAVCDEPEFARLLVALERYETEWVQCMAACEDSAGRTHGRQLGPLRHGWDSAATAIVVAANIVRYVRAS